MRKRRKNRVEMQVDNLMTDPDQTHEMVWLKSTEDDVMLPIAIGQTEYLAIYSELTGEKMPRPLTHDLLRDILKHFDAEVAEVHIVDLVDDIFYAELVLLCNGDHLRMDARPSDCIALALKYQAPIYADEKVLADAGIRARMGQDGLEYEDLRPPDEEEEALITVPEKQLAREVENMLDELDLAEGENLSPNDRMMKLKRMMEKAVKEERYEEAGKIRNEIQRLEKGRQAP